MILRLVLDVLPYLDAWLGWLIWACIDHVVAHGFPALGCPVAVGP